MRLAILLFTLICSVSAIDARSIHGIVFSASDSTAVVGANCSLLDDGKMVGGTVADADGAFNINTEHKSALTLKISMTGFSSTEIIIEQGTRNLNLGTIYLDEGVALGEVSVTASSVVKSNGRTIVYPSSADVKASSTSIGLFQKLPLIGLQSNPITRTISVDGGTPVILINGVPSTIDDLNALQPKDIEKIEYSRFTPARYADSEKSGFLNITLKKRSDGGQIYAWGRSAVTTAFVDANIRASYHQGASQFTLQYMPSWRNYNKVYDNKSESYLSDEFNVGIESHDRNPFSYHMHPVKLKYDYSPSTKTLFTATFNINPGYSKRRAMSHNSDSELGDYDNFNRVKDNTLVPSLDLFLHQDINDKNSLEVQLVATMSSDDYRRTNNYTFADGSEESYVMDVDSRRRSLISELSYKHTFCEKSSLSAGYQNTVSRSTNTYLLTDYEPVLTENNNYAYARYSLRIGRVNLDFSSGIKMYWTENDLIKRRYIRNLSRAHLSWNINQRWNVEAAFRYSSAIPSLSSITDNPQQTTPYLISNGNPDQKVSDFLLYNLGVDYTYKKFQASFSSVYLNMKNDRMTDVRYLGDGKFLSSSVNVPRKHLFQNLLSLGISDFHGLGANIDVQLSYYKGVGDGWSHDLTSLSGSLSLWWNKGPYTVSYWRKLPGKYLSGHYVGKDENGDALQFD